MREASTVSRSRLSRTVNPLGRQNTHRFTAYLCALYWSAGDNWKQRPTEIYTFMYMNTRKNSLSFTYLFSLICSNTGLVPLHVLNLMNINLFLVSLLLFITMCLITERLSDVTLFIMTWLFLLQKNLEKFVQDCYDAIALFLCIHLILRYRLMCHKRAVPALDQYWNTLQDVIWPRYVLWCCGK
jgi:hypothetical protein